MSPNKGQCGDGMGKFALKCFGVGDGWPCADRNHASFLYRFGKESILIDCGEPISSRYKATGLPYDTIDRIFISHLHADHVAGFLMLMQGFWLERRKKELPVHLPTDGIEPLAEMLKAGMVFDELLQFRLRFVALQAGKPVMTGKVRVTPHRSSHLERLRQVFQKKYPLKFEAFSFLIEAGRLRIGHSADIGRPEDLEPLLQRPLDLLVCELSHFRPEDMFRYLNRRKVKRVVFVHLGRAEWNDLKGTRRLAEKMLGRISVTFARDGEEITL
jgi:ribonuclease BN (tRNA processing enzyme)